MQHATTDEITEREQQAGPPALSDGYSTHQLAAGRRSQQPAYTTKRRMGILAPFRIGHSSLRTGDRLSHTHEEVEYRRSAVGNVGLDRVLSPK